MGRQFSTAFSTAFEMGEGVLTITDTDILQLPIDAVLAGQQPYEDRGVEYDIRPRNLRSKTTVKRSGVQRLKGAAPSFSTTTSKKGYD